MALLAKNPLEEDEKRQQQSQQLGRAGAVPAGPPGVGTQLAKQAGMKVLDKTVSPLIDKGISSATNALASQTGPLGSVGSWLGGVGSTAAPAGHAALLETAAAAPTALLPGAASAAAGTTAATAQGLASGAAATGAAGAGIGAGLAAAAPLAIPLLLGGKIFGLFNEGGQVMGPLAENAPNMDTVPAMLTEGEFVLNKEATQMFGPLIEATNQAGLKRRNQNG